MNDLEKRVDQLVDRAVETVEMITTKADEDELGPALSLLDDLEDIADEAEDLLSTVDLTELARAVDWSELPDAVDLSDIREAIEEGDGSEVVAVRDLIRLVELREVWENVDAREAWRQKRELEDEVGDVTGESEADEEDGLLDKSMSAGGGHDLDSESVENAIQMQINDSVEAFRKKLIAAHDRLDEVRQRNKDRFPDRRRKRSRNPTAVSTLPAEPAKRAEWTRYSTVPAETLHSSAPNHRRIYGPRFRSVDGEDDE